jgi:tRNA threonylcarbamoyladenosine biosynthesis protein TsaB
MLLAIQTSSVPGSVALGRVEPASGEVEILAQAEFAARSNSALLIPKIGEMLAACGAEVRDLEAIVVVRGPGSFTGIRVGLSAAKGLAEVSGSKIIALSQLALLASSSGHKHVLAAIDAGRGEYYAGEYLEGRALSEALLTASELCAATQSGPAVLVFEEACQNASELNSRGGSGLPCEAVLIAAPDAGAALRLASARFCAGVFDDVATLDANYLRRSDAEIFGPKSVLKQ